MFRDGIIMPASTSRARLACRILPLVVLGLASTTMLAAPAKAETLGRYCSVTWTNGGWALKYYTNLTQDPCADIAKQYGSGGTIQRAGLYSVSGMTNVVARCGTNPGVTYVQLYQGIGYGPLTAAYNKVIADKQKTNTCIFTAAPRELPIFNAPFPLSTNYTHNSGMDFARWFTIDVTQFGQPGSHAATKVDWQGRDMSTSKYGDNHNGIDYNMPEHVPIQAAAAGKVLLTRFRPVDHTNPGCPGSLPTQGEIYIEHTISGATGKVVSPGAATTIYDEKIISYYAHVSDYKDVNGHKMKAGDIVPQSKIIGHSGTTGCSSASHLHFGTWRTTNTTGHRNYSFAINTIPASGKMDSDNQFDVLIDPYGFYPPKGFDPWAWMVFPKGALSINLWKQGQAPSRGGW